MAAFSANSSSSAVTSARSVNFTSATAAATSVPFVPATTTARSVFPCGAAVIVLLMRVTTRTPLASMTPMSRTAPSTNGTMVGVVVAGAAIHLNYASRVAGWWRLSPPPATILSIISHFRLELEKKIPYVNGQKPSSTIDDK